MPLNLKSVMPERDYITSKTGKKLWINPEVPEELIFNFQDLKNIDPNDFKHEDFKRVVDMSKQFILNDSENKKEDVEELFDKASFVDKMKIITFVSEFLSGSLSPEKQKKKTDSKA